jgi:hypothetical protein
VFQVVVFILVAGLLHESAGDGDHGAQRGGGGGFGQRRQGPIL